jgi:hypothetical protein
VLTKQSSCQNGEYGEVLSFSAELKVFTLQKKSRGMVTRYRDGRDGWRLLTSQLVIGEDAVF